MLKTPNLPAAGLLCLSAVSAVAEVKPPAALSSDMALQRDMRTPFWGWAASISWPPFPVISATVLWPCVFHRDGAGGADTFQS